MKILLPKIMMVLLISCLVVIILGEGGITPAMADYEQNYKKGNTIEYLLDSKINGDGSEATGQIALWLFAIANVVVVISLLLKGAVWYLPISLCKKDKVRRMNQVQKKYLMPLHYILNPFALFLAFIHFSLSSCRATFLPEWGLYITAILLIIGIGIKFKISPKFLRKGIYILHTNPLIFVLIVTILIFGHIVVD